MRIVIDLQGAQSSGSRNRGIGRYSTALTAGMLRNSNGHDIHLLCSAAFPESVAELRKTFAELVPPSNFHVWEPLPAIAAQVDGSQGRRVASQLLREAAIRRIQPDVVHITSLFEGLVDDAAVSIGEQYGDIPVSVTVYDLIPLINKKRYLSDRRVAAWYMERVDQLRRASAFFSISESARQEVCEQLGVDPELVVNVGTAADPQFQKVKLTRRREADLRARYSLDRQFVMYTGGIDFRKNIEGLIRAYAKLPKAIRAEHQLAIVCSANETDKKRLETLAGQEGLQPDELVMTGFVPEDDLIALYNLARLFVFPSWHEGFGLPALEAMHCGTPVIGSNRSSLPEVIGLEEAMFDPFDDQAIADSISKALTDDRFRARLLDQSRRQPAKFSWDESAQRAIAALERIHHAAEPVSAPADVARPRLAFVTPMPPARTGIADYAGELLPYLTAHYRIDVVVKDEAVDLVDHPLVPDTIGIVSARQFAGCWQDYDRIVYQFGNSEFHDYMFPLLAQTSGVAVLHDFYLSGAISYREWHNQDPYAWTRELYLSHGYPAAVFRRDADDPYDVVWRYPASQSPFRDAKRIIVHSEFSKGLAQRWYGDKATGKIDVIPHLRVPLAQPASRALARKRLNLADDDFVVCSFGMLGESKCNLDLIQAWQQSRLASDPRNKLVFVGRNEQGAYGKQVSSELAESPAGTISITGYADRPSFEDYLAACDVSVQLRRLSRGETSGTVLDCMSNGVPLIVNDNGAMGQLAADAAIVLKDEFDVPSLVAALERMRRDAKLRAKLSKAGPRHIEERHLPATCADAYRRSIEHAYRELAIDDGMLARVRDARLSDHEAGLFAGSLASLRTEEKPRLFVDVSVIERNDAKTGVQRVVRNILREAVTREIEGWRVEPVYVDPEAATFRFARRFMADFLDVKVGDVPDDIVDFKAGDQLLLLDLNPVLLPFTAAKLERLKTVGVKVSVVVYDLLPVKWPQFFPDEAEEAHRQWLGIAASADQALCISRSVATDLRQFIEREHPDSKLEIAHFPLGNELDQRTGGSGPSTDALANVALDFSLPTFLVVGTIEPRKGHADVLEAFEALWADGEQVNLCIVGKRGWRVDELATRISDLDVSEPRFSWQEAVSDTTLEALYRKSDCLIASSLDEGFGLPLVEAAQRDLPLLVRDIPVFREVCGTGAAYFTGDLLGAVRNWLDASRLGKIRPCPDIAITSWKDSADNLLKQVIGRSI